MTTPTISPLGDHDDGEVIGYVTAAQADPAQHVTYVGDDPVTVRADLTAAADWRARTFVARDGHGNVVGVLTVDVDDDLGRLWWLGPWADARATAMALLDVGAGVAPEVREREFAPDSRNIRLADIAVARGYRGAEASAVLTADLADWRDGTAGHVQVPHVRELDLDDQDDVARLHDHLFPGTHTRGRSLVRDADTTVLVSGEPPAGYVATQVQADGALYIDFVGVDPGVRRRGLGRALVATAMARAASDGSPRAFLTVRVGNRSARELYAALGFTEERMIAPYIKGFTRDG